jgi:hypothetical protein
MPGKSDPSIYNERTSIGSSDDLDEYGVWVKTEPQDLSTSLPDIEELPDFDSEFGDELPDLENVTADDFSLEDMESVSIEDLEMPDLSDEDEDAGSADSVSAEIEPMDIDIEFEEIPEDLELPEGLAASNIDADGFTEVSMDDFLDPSDTGTPESIDFGDLDSSVSEIEMLDSYEEAVSPSAVYSSRERPSDLSTQLLQKIADELSSIKKEISGLKNELSVVRGEVKAQENAEAAGFFDEEDDEKIALTGDELDNILNTANFTEETGAGEGTETALPEETLLTEAEIPPEVLPEFPLETIQTDGITVEDESPESIEINFDEELGELDSAVQFEDNLSIPDSDDFDIELDLTPDFREDSSELDALREEGAVPVTEAPEDTSYLDDEIDLPDMVIDEPDLSEAIRDIPVSEPVIDNISIDLEMEETLPETAGPDDFIFEAEETLEIPAAELPELEEELPSIESIDDSSLEDLLPAISEEVDFTEADVSDEAKTAGRNLSGFDEGIPNNLKQELKTVLSYMDQLLESLPEEKIEEFAKSEYFETYKKLFEELGLV